jgi:hypothetical protein
LGLEAVPTSSRTCDLCNDTVTSEDRAVVGSFVLTDWGVLRFECRDRRIGHHDEFEIVKVCAKSQTMRNG